MLDVSCRLPATFLYREWALSVERLVVPAMSWHGISSDGHAKACSILLLLDLWVGEDKEVAGERLTTATPQNNHRRREVSDMARIVWRVGITLYIISVMVLCLRLAMRVDLCIRDAPFADSLCCLGSWGSSFPLTAVCVGAVGELCSLLALRRGRENVAAGGFIGVVLGFALGGVLQDVVRYCCQ